MTLSFTLDGSGTLDIHIDALIVAGWTGRDKAAVQHHIDELGELGVAPPSKTPLFYRVGADLLTQADRIQVVGEATSGEAEAVLIAGPDGRYVTLGSDHTDREAEAASVALSKQACPKPRRIGTSWCCGPGRGSTARVRSIRRARWPRCCRRRIFWRTMVLWHRDLRCSAAPCLPSAVCVPRRASK